VYHGAGMKRRMIMALLVYITLDLSSPFVPGSFNFDPDQCVEGIHRASTPQGLAVATVLTRLPVLRLVLPAPPSIRPVTGGCHTVLEWLVDSRDSTRASADPPPPSEDH
jgi:hypothetical protein